MPDQPSSMPHESDAMAGPHGTMADHGETHGHDDHAHGDEAMALGLVVVACLVISMGLSPAPAG